MLPFPVCFTCVRFEVLPEGVGPGVSGSLRLVATRVTFDTGYYNLPASCAGRITCRVDVDVDLLSEGDIVCRVSTVSSEGFW